MLSNLKKLYRDRKARGLKRAIAKPLELHKLPWRSTFYVTVALHIYEATSKTGKPWE